VYIKLEAL